jgi:hypothetical protein
MDWNAAIENNRETLKRVLAMLIAMAGLDDGCPTTLPRCLHRAVLRLLRPAESAVRRLIIVAARGLVVALPPLLPRRPKPVRAEPLLRSLGIAVVMSPADLARAAAAERAAAIRAVRPRGFSLPLFDPLPNPFRDRRRTAPAQAVPRILFPGIAEPFSIPPPPSPDDPIDAARLGRRLAALAVALDDLPGQAKRFARWRARRDAANAQARQGRHEGRARVWPLKPGRPPGWRRKPDHEVHEVLDVVHGLAFWALASPRTS